MLCVFIDALNPSYLRHMPFLKSLSKGNLHGSLEVPLGYTSIIASFVTGRWPEKHGIFDLFKLADAPSMQIKNKYILALIRLIENKRFFYSPLQIPCSMSRFFQPSMEKAWAQKSCLPCSTIFDILETNHKSFEVIDWPNRFKNRHAAIFLSKSFEHILNLTKKAKADFIFTHFLDLEIAHEFGIRARETIDIARQIDDAARQLYEKDENILFFSDHSMNDIEKEVDIATKINELNLKFGKDIIYIIGSTTVEFWFKSPLAEKRVTELLKSVKEGKIADSKEFRLPKTSDLLFLADLGTAFYPNFFSRKRFKAMHGWNSKQQKTLYLLKNDKGIKGEKNAKMVDFFPTILKLLKLPQIKCDGRSLV